jgi:hypothetical protein
MAQHGRAAVCSPVRELKRNRYTYRSIGYTAVHGNGARVGKAFFHTCRSRLELSYRERNRAKFGNSIILDQAR